MNKQLILSKTFKCSCCYKLVPKYKLIYDGYKPIDQRTYINCKVVCQRCFYRLNNKQRKKRNNVAENMVGLKYGL